MTMPSEAEYLERPVRQFLDDLAAARPTPGGGSAAALTGALAAGLTRMVANYSGGKERAADARDRLGVAVQRLERAEMMLRMLVREDMVAYAALSEALRLGPDRPSRQAELTAGLAGAIAVPFEVVTIASALLEEIEAIKEISKRQLLADLGAAAALAVAAAAAAGFNVRTNLRLLPNRSEAERLARQLGEQLQQAEQRRERIDRFLADKL